MAQLKKGESVDAGDRAGLYWKVKTKDGKEGFVSVVAVQRQAGNSSGLQSALVEEAKKARAAGTDESGRARSAVMGVRGLSEGDQLADVGSMRPDLKAVYRMEDRSLSDKRVDKLEKLVQQEMLGVSQAK